MNNLIFVDCEASGPCIGKGELTEFGAVHYPLMGTFYGDMSGLWEIDKKIIPDSYPQYLCDAYDIFLKFDEWLKERCEEHQPIFVSDNPAFDFQWISYNFHYLLGYNPFGWSARRIGDYYAGLTGNFRNATKWKKFRITKHTHHPVDDAMGNAEAFKYIEEHKEELRRIIKAEKKPKDFIKEIQF